MGPRRFRPVLQFPLLDTLYHKPGGVKRNFSVLFPQNEAEKERKEDAQEDARCNRKVQREALPPYDDVPWELTDEWDFVREKYYGPYQNQEDASYYHQPADLIGHIPPSSKDFGKAFHPMSSLRVPLVEFERSRRDRFPCKPLSNRFESVSGETIG